MYTSKILHLFSYVLREWFRVSPRKGLNLISLIPVKHGFVLVSQWVGELLAHHCVRQRLRTYSAKPLFEQLNVTEAINKCS